MKKFECNEEKALKEAFKESISKGEVFDLNKFKKERENTRMKYWKNQTSETQKSRGEIQFVNLKDNTQIAISHWDFDKKPKDWQFTAHSVEEARKGYPNNKLGITKQEAIKCLNKYMKEHNNC
jgi:hypothetical protein